MTFKIGDMKKLLTELICTRCDKLLSVFPIYTSSSLGNVCGRCTESVEWMISNNCIERNTTYESLAKVILFPCTNRKLGCTLNLKHDEIVNHEKCCSHRSRTCPFNVDICDSVLQCDWKGGIINLNAHLDLNHTSRKINNPHTFTLNTNESGVKVYFVKFELQTFLLLTRYDGETKKFCCLVMCCDVEKNCKKYAYQMELQLGKGDDFFFNLRKSNTEALMDTSEALEKVENMLTVDVAAAMALFGNADSNLNCRITISKKTNEKGESTSILKEPTNSKPTTSTPKEPTNSKPTTSTPKEPTNSKPKTSTTNQHPLDAEQTMLHSNNIILEELECPVCNHYMRPPIYICTEGHSLCNECKIKIVQCPICRVPSINIRNFALERLTQKVMYPCRYSLNGCTQVLNINVIVQHESACNFATNCPLRMLPIPCKNVKEVILNPISHINEKHIQDILDRNLFHSRSLKAKVTSTYKVAIINNEIFIICCKHSQTTGPLKFNFLHIGMKSNVPTYRYTLEFKDQNKLGLKLTAEQPCQAVPARISDAFQNCLTIPFEMLKPLMISNNIVYKFNVKKI